MIGTIYNLIQSLKILKEQVSALVGCKSSCKAYCKHIVPEGLINLDYLLRRIVVGRSICSKVSLYLLYQPCLKFGACLPNLLCRDFAEALEAVLIIVVGCKLRPEDLCVNLLPLRSCPGWVVHTICNITYI